MIGIIGQGFVGNAIYQKFKNYFTIHTYDLDESKCNSTKERVLECETIFVCLPTPMNEDGSCYTGYVEQAIADINEVGKCKRAVIKSTIPPGTTEKFNLKYKNVSVIFNPEFLTERNAVKDFENQKRIILGGPRPATTHLKRVYSVAFNDVHIIKTGSTHAEFIKYITNCYLANKVSFANEMYQMATKMGLDYDKVLEYALFDERLGTSHWAVKGPDGYAGFGGHCLPKDLNALIAVAEEIGIDPIMMKATREKNDEVRKYRDWENMKGRAVL